MIKVQEGLFISRKPLGTEADEAHGAESSSLGPGGCGKKPQNLVYPQGEEEEKEEGQNPKMTKETLK